MPVLNSRRVAPDAAVALCPDPKPQGDPSQRLRSALRTVFENVGFPQRWQIERLARLAHGTVIPADLAFVKDMRNGAALQFNHNSGKIYFTLLQNDFVRVDKSYKSTLDSYFALLQEAVADKLCKQSPLRTGVRDLADHIPGLRRSGTIHTYTHSAGDTYV